MQLSLSNRYPVFLFSREINSSKLIKHIQHHSQLTVAILLYVISDIIRVKIDKQTIVLCYYLYYSYFKL